MVCPPTAAPISTAIPASSTMMPWRRLLRENRAEAPARRMKLPQMNFCIRFSPGENICRGVMTPKIKRS